MLVSWGEAVFIARFLMKRTHNCSQLRNSDTGSTVTLSGWVDSVRDHGGILFVDLRDREGLTQIVLDPSNQGLEAQFGSIKPESVISVTGKVDQRFGGVFETFKISSSEAWTSISPVASFAFEVPPKR